MSLKRSEVTACISAFPCAPTFADELAAEASCGTGLARKLVEHISRMGASGYSNEVEIDCETWIISAARRTIA